jgi:methyl-accepting chemotaxis protein
MDTAKPKFRSLKAKIGWTLGLIMFLTAGILIIFTSLTARQEAVKTARENALANAKEYGNLISKDIERAVNASLTLAETFSAVKANQNSLKITRREANNILSEVLLSDPAYFGVSMAWEPNAFDQLDTAYVSADSMHDVSGRYIPYLFKSKGKLIGETTAGYDKGTFYTVPRDSRREFIMDPQSWTIGGESITLTTISVPILYNGEFLGIVGLDILTAWMQNVVKENLLYDGRAQISVISNNGTFAATTLSDTLVGKKLDKIFPERASQFEALTSGLDGEVIDNDNLRVFAPMYLGKTDTPWQISITVPKEVIYADANQQMRNMIIISLALLALGLGGILWFIQKLVKPLTHMVKITHKMSTGQLDEERIYSKNDEIGLMSEALTRLRTGLKQTSEFAYEIGKGNLNAEFKALSEDDTLGNSLLGMRNSLKEVAEEDKKRAWVTEGLANFGELLRNNSQNVEELSRLVLARLVNYLEVNQGCIYLLKKEEDGQAYLELASTYAWNKQKFMEDRLAVGEGLAGQAVQERSTLYFTDVPENHVQITSGLGNANPTAILIVPLMVNEELVGVVELAAFKEVPDYRIKFVEKVGESIAATLINTRNNQMTRELLEESQQITEEKRATEEELMQNQEELQATTEEMQRTIEELRKENQQLRRGMLQESDS